MGLWSQSILLAVVCVIAIESTYAVYEPHVYKGHLRKSARGIIEYRGEHKEVDTGAISPMASECGSACFDCCCGVRVHPWSEICTTCGGCCDDWTYDCRNEVRQYGREQEDQQDTQQASELDQNFVFNLTLINAPTHTLIVSNFSQKVEDEQEAEAESENEVSIQQASSVCNHNCTITGLTCVSTCTATCTQTATATFTACVGSCTAPITSVCLNACITTFIANLEDCVSDCSEDCVAAEQDCENECGVEQD